MNEKNSSSYISENQLLKEPEIIQVSEPQQIFEKAEENIPAPDINYKLPPKQKINYDFDINEKKKLTDKELEIVDVNRKYLESKLWYWAPDNHFKFDLPPTIFKEKKVIDQNEGYQYHNSEIKYLNPSMVGKRFPKEILGQIWNKGEFHIESNIPDFPYTWKITECMIKGYENVKNSYANILSASFMFVYTLKFRFYSDKYEEFCFFSFISCFYHFYHTFVLLIDLLFGTPKYFKDYSSTKEEIIHQRVINFINNNRDLDFEFFNDKTKEELKQFDEKFETKWVQEISPSLMNQYINHNKEEIVNIIKNKKLEEYLKYLNSNEQFNEFEKSHPSAKDYLLSQQILNDRTFHNNLQQDIKIKKYEEVLKKSYVKYLCDYWREDKMRIYMEKVKKNTIEKIQTEVKREISDKKDPYSVYDFNTKNDNEIPELVKKGVKNKKIPRLKYDLIRNFCCYNKVQYTNSQGRNLYKLEKKVYYKIKSTICFWRLKLFVVKYFCDIWNFNIFIFKLMVDSMFGIKALFLIELYRDNEIDSSTGEIIESNRTTTFPLCVWDLWTMVKESRKEFEEAPDTGILGKGCMRIFHLIYNYIILLFFLGLLLIIFYPLIIIFNVIICIILLVLSPIIITIWTILSYIFMILIYNVYDDELSMLPIIFIIIVELIYGFFIQLIGVFFALIFQPILSFLIFLFAQIYFIARMFHNCFFISIIACFGRVPQSDSCVAWQTSGPGIFVDRYYDLSNKDIIHLVTGHLEKIILKNYQKRMNKILESPKIQIKEVKQTFGMLGFDFILTDEFEESINYYKKKLESQIKSHDIYPTCNVRVKFTKERLQEVKYMISVYVSKYAKAYDLSSELNNYKNIDLFVEEILKSIFGYSILIPLESAEKVTHLKSIFENEIDVIAKKIFENPYFQDKIIVEEDIENNNDNSINNLNGPNVANFGQVFKGDLYLKYYYLHNRNIRELDSKSENIINIKFEN